MKRRIWWDCSYIYAHPQHNTGIQRVTRELGNALAQLCSTPEAPYSFHPCISLDTGTVLELATIPAHNAPPPNVNAKPETLYPPDIFLVPDTSWDQRILANKAASWRAGVTTGIIQYDVVPITHPDTTTEYMVATFTDWVQECATFADFFACISQTTSHEIQRVLQEQYPWRQLTPADIFTFPLGTWLTDSSPPKPKLASNSRQHFLAVGTIEPRKQYDLILDAFSDLWAVHPDLGLTIVGTAGWKTGDVIQRIRDIQAAGAPLIWLDQASDQDLQAEYASATALIAASAQEGFGLPSIEALSLGTPVIAADIPIFREVAGDSALYFEPNDPSSLASTLLALASHTLDLPKLTGDFVLPTWQDSARSFLASLQLCATPKHTLRSAYDRRVAHLVSKPVPQAERQPATAPSEQSDLKLAHITAALKALYANLSRRRIFGYPLRLANAIIHSSSTRWHLFQVEQTLAHHISLQASLADTIATLQDDMRFLETRLISLITLEHEHSRAVIESVLAMMDEPSESKLP